MTITRNVSQRSSEARFQLRNWIIADWKCCSRKLKARNLKVKTVKVKNVAMAFLFYLIRQII